MNTEKMKELVLDAVNDADLTPADIPPIDLYLDQITGIMADKLQEGSPRFQDRVLTKTMINNYSKDKLISPIKGKKYTKEQILQMLLVYSLKNTLSIGEIKQLLQSLYHSEGYNEKMLEEIYLRFLDIKQLERTEMWGMIESFADRNQFDLESNTDFYTFLLGLAAWSSYLKNVVQALLEEQVKKAAKKEKKAQKASKKDENKELKKVAAEVAREEDEKEGLEDASCAGEEPAPSVEEERA